MFDRRWRRRLLILATVGLLAVLGACAGEEAAPTATATATATTAAPVGEAPTVTETVVAEVTATVEAPAYDVTRIGKYGGVMRWAVKALWTGSAGTDALRAGSITQQSFYGPQYSRLIRFDPFKWGDTPGNSIVPDLATSWEVEDGGKRFVFHLRNDAYFHDGTQVTCQDVVTSWEHSVRQGGYRGEFKDFYAGSECLDEWTPVFKLTTSLAKTLPMMAGSGGAGWSIVPHKQIIALGGVDHRKQPKESATVGSGAFKFKSADPAAGWEGVRVDNFYLFDAAGNRLPYLDGYISFAITDVGTRNAAYLGGQLDAIQSVTLEPRSALEILKAKPDHTVLEVGPADWYYVFGRKVAPFDNYNVRKAFHLAFDRHANAAVTDPKWGIVQGIVETVWGGFTVEEVSQMPGFRVDKTEDWAEANRLLDEAGLPRKAGGVRFTFNQFTELTQEYLDNTILYASDLLKIGVSFRMDLPIDYAEEGTRSNACDYTSKGDRSSNSVDADPELREYVIIDESGTGTWVCGWRTPQYMRDLFLEQSSTVDPVARKAKIRALELAFYEDRDYGYYRIPRHVTSYLIGHWPFVKGGGWDRNWFARFDHTNVYEVWLDKK